MVPCGWWLYRRRDFAGAGTWAYRECAVAAEEGYVRARGFGPASVENSGGQLLKTGCRRLRADAED
jgi:hypothetical protein